MQVKVPKFIEIEDTIISVGGFGITWKQFLALALGLGGGFIAFRIFIPAVGVPIMIVSSILGSAIAFGRVNGLPLATYLSAAIRFFYRPNTYIWKQTPPRVTFDTPPRTENEVIEKSEGPPQTIDDAEKKLAEVAELLDRQ